MALMVSAWEEGRPLYLRLPEESQTYQGNEVVEWITRPFDRTLMEIHSAIANVERDFLDPRTCREDALDWLAQYAGFTGEYWDATWSDAIKRQLIEDAQTKIWPNKGRKSLLEYFFALFDIDATIYQIGLWIAGVTPAGSVYGGDDPSYLILMPLSQSGYLRTSPEWQLVEKLNRLYSHVGVRSHVQYRAWYAGFSAAGDTYFDPPIVGA